MNKTRIKKLEKIVDDIYEEHEESGDIKIRWELPFNVYIGKRKSTCVFCPKSIEYGIPKVYTRNGTAHIECMEQQIEKAREIKNQILNEIKNDNCPHPIDKIIEKNRLAFCQECGIEKERIIDFSTGEQK